MTKKPKPDSPETITPQAPQATAPEPAADDDRFLARVKRIKQNGDEDDIELDLNDWRALAKAIDANYIEHVRLPDGRHMYVDEEGLLRERKQNAKATYLRGGGYIAGDVLIFDDETHKRYEHWCSLRD